MVGDKITQMVQDLQKQRDNLREIRKSIKNMEKVDSAEYIELKKSYKDLRDQMKELEEDWRNNLLQDDEYNELRDLRLKTEEELANNMEKLFEVIDQLPRQPWQKNLDTEYGLMKVNVQPEMRLYLNGKEEKKRV